MTRPAVPNTAPGTDPVYEDQVEAWIEAITQPHLYVPHELYDEITKPAERAFGEMLAEIRRLREARDACPSC